MIDARSAGIWEAFARKNPFLHAFFDHRQDILSPAGIHLLDLFAILASLVPPPEIEEDHYLFSPLDQLDLLVEEETQFSSGWTERWYLTPSCPSGQYNL